MSAEFGRYVIVKPVGTGGMAEVHLAHQVGFGGFVKPCVLKRIAKRFSDDPRVLRMFLEEARISALLNHPNIVQTFDFGEFEGAPYMAMELVDGMNLLSFANQCDQRAEPIPASIAVEIVALVLDALAYAHALKDLDGKPLHVVHRDVSPQNVLLSREGSVKLADFGIARHDARDEHTQGIVAKGKPGYMSPEASLGHGVDGKTDVYACGIVLVELLTLSKFHTAETPFGGLEGIAKRVEERLADRPEIGAQLAATIHEMTAISPEERLDARSAAEKLRRAIPTLPTSTSLVEYLRARISESLVGETPPVPSGAKSPEFGSLDLKGWPTLFGNQEVRKGVPVATEAPAPAKPLALKVHPGARGPSSPKLPTPSAGAPAKPVNPGPVLKGANPLGELTAKDAPKNAIQRQIEREKREQARARTFLGVVLVGALAALVGPKLLQKPPPPPKTSGKLVLQSEPAGASVRINDIPHPEATPTTIPDLPLDSDIEVRLSKPGFVARPKISIVRIPSDTAEATVELTMEPAARFEVASEPPGAKVEVDGETLVGLTPLGFDLGLGRSATITVSKAGFIAAKRPVTARERKSEALLVTLEPSLLLEISSDPSAEVTVDGAPKGKTPIELELPAAHSTAIGLDTPGYKPVRRSFDPKKPQKKWEIRLEPIPFERMALLPSERSRFNELRRAEEAARRNRIDARARLRAVESKLSKLDFNESMEERAKLEETIERMRADAEELEATEEETKTALESLKQEVIGRIEAAAR